MKATIARESFLAAFSQAASVAPTRGPKEALHYVLFTAETSGAVTLVATDLEQSISVPVPGVETSKPGRAMLPVATFGSILRESSDDSLLLSLDAKNNLTIAGKTSNYKLPTMDPEEFPPFEDNAPDTYHTVPCAAFKTAIDRTSFCCDETGSRYALGGIYVELDKRRLTAVATDGRRMGKVECSATDEGQGDKKDHIVPNRAMRNLSKLLADREGECQFHLTSNWARFEVGGVVFRARLLEGRFPRWRDVIPTAKDTTDIEISVGPFLKAVKQASIAIRGDSRALDFSFAEGQCTLSAKSEGGQSQIDLPISFDNGKKEVSLDHAFVSEMLQRMPSEAQLTLRIIDGEHAVQFVDGDGYVYVVMPLSRDQ